MIDTLKYYTNTGTRKTIKRCQELNIGLLIVSPNWVNPERWPYYAIDNGAYANWRAGENFSGPSFIGILKRARKYERQPDFVVLPDIVGGGQKSLELSLEWLSILKKYDFHFSYYLAVQDGMNSDTIWDVIKDNDIRGIFVGGTLQWKLATAEEWCKLASELNVGCHIGRVGPVNRIVWARHIGATSIDSTTWVQRNGSIEYVDRARKQSTLKEAI